MIIVLPQQNHICNTHNQSSHTSQDKAPKGTEAVRVLPVHDKKQRRQAPIKHQAQTRSVEIM